MQVKHNDSSIDRIKKMLLSLPFQKVKEIENFIEFISSKSSQEHISLKKVEKLEGIWQGLGFENINLEKEIMNLRQEINESIDKKGHSWNI